MDAFEQVMAAVLQRQGYWTATSVKVDLTKEEKVRIGRPSSPRWELDLVAYKGSTNELLVIECKSFLDSPGVRVKTFQGSNKDDQSTYKLFFDVTLRETVLTALTKQLEKHGFCPTGSKVKLCLAAGKIAGDASALEGIFAANGWTLFTPAAIAVELRKLRDLGYENSVAAVVAKILLRSAPEPTEATPGIEADV